MRGTRLVKPDSGPEVRVLRNGDAVRAPVLPWSGAVCPCVDGLIRSRDTHRVIPSTKELQYNNWPAMATEKPDSLMFPLFPVEVVDKAAEAWTQNVADWADVLKGYQEGLESCASEGAQHYQERHKDRGLLLGISESVVCGVDGSERSSHFVAGPRHTVPRVGTLCRVQARDFIALGKSNYWHRSSMVTCACNWD